MKRISVQQYLDNPKKAHKKLTERRVLEVHRADLVKLMDGADELVVSPLVMAEAKACGAALSGGQSYTFKYATLMEILEDEEEGTSNVTAMTGEPISTAVVVGVLVTALLVGFAIGYVGSDMADGDGNGNTTNVENNGNGDVIVK